MHNFWEIYYSLKSRIRHITKQDRYDTRLSRHYCKKYCMTPKEMNAYIAEVIESGTPFMSCRYGGFELLAMQAAEFNNPAKLHKAIEFLDKNAGFFPHDEKLLYRFNEVYKNATASIDVLGCWFVTYEEYFVRRYASEIKYIGSLMALEPWECPENPWSKALKGKKVLVIHPFEKTIRSQYERRDKLFAGTDILPEFELITLKAVQTSGSQKDDRFDTWFEALDYMCAETDKLDFNVALIGCGAYGFPLAAHIKQMGKQAFHMGGVLQILFGIKGRRWDESDTSKLYNDYWVYPDESETPKGAEAVEGACYWAPENKEEK